MIEFFVTYKPVFVIIHAFSAAVGFGAVVVTDTLFFRFLKDFKISPKENETLKIVSQVVWVAIGFLISSGVCLYLSNPVQYLESSKFITKIFIFSVIVLNGVILNKVLTPYLTKISFGPTNHAISKRLQFLRSLAFASGAVSLLSWVSVFLLGSLRSIPIETELALLVYACLACIAIIGSQIYSFILKHKKAHR